MFSSSPLKVEIAGVSTLLVFTSFMVFAAGSAFCDWAGIMCLHKLSSKSFSIILTGLNGFLVWGCYC